MVVDLEKIIELEREDRLRPRLRDREFGDWMYFLKHPLHQHDVEMFTYYFNMGLGLFALRCCFKYAIWVKKEFFAAKARDDIEIERRIQALLARQQQVQDQSQTITNRIGERLFSTSASRTKNSSRSSRIRPVSKGRLIFLRVLRY